MTNQEESRLTMYLIVKDFLAKHTAITSKLPDYAENSAIWLSMIPQIQLYSQQQKTSNRGVTADKKLLKTDLTVLTEDHFRKLRAYAKLTKNVTLAEKVNISESKLKAATDTAIRDYAQLAYDVAKDILPSLVKYSINEASQTALEEAIESYSDSIGKPGAQRVEDGQTTKQLKVMFATADDALNNIDAAVDVVKLTEPAFYNGYQKARVVIVTGRGTLAVKIIVTDEKGEPIKGVTITLTLEGSEEQAAIVKKTAKKGGCYLKNLAEGNYMVTAQKNGYVKQTKNMSVTGGEMTVLKIQMVKS